MPNNQELSQNIKAIYKFVFENQPVHRNTVKKKLLLSGKINSKAKYSEAYNYLLNSGKLVIQKEDVSINPELIEIGVVQKSRHDAYVLTPYSKKHLNIPKSVSAGYKSGDLVNIVVENVGDLKEVIILGRNQNQEILETETQKQAQHNVDKDNCLLGRVVKISHDDLVFIPNNKNLPIRHIPILNSKEEFASFQDKICVMELLEKDGPLLGGHIIEIKGDAGNPIHEYDAIAENYGAIMSWEGARIQEEIAKIPTSVDTSNLNLINETNAKYMQRGNVVDLRHIPFVTIDPATCKDMDDAIYSTFNDNGDIVCYTAVANVTKYFDLESEIGKRYINGGFTIYAPNKAYNILPTELSTGICSLNPNEDRLAFVVKTVIDKKSGQVKESNIYDALIKSREKYSYELAQDIVDDLEEEFPREYLFDKYMLKQELDADQQILMNYYAGQVIKNGFEKRKMIRFIANKEREIEFDSDMQTVVDITPVPHLYYHEVIEAFMVTANEATAKYAKDNGLDNIYRIHEEPNYKKVQRASEFFTILGIDFDGNLSAEKTRELINLIKGTENEEIINKFLIKMQSRAVYNDDLFKSNSHSEKSDTDISHYALQSKHYSHTTSPIRRVPDYITQYNILAHMHKTEPIPLKTIQEIVTIANERQLDVDQAEKDFEDISSVMYCEQHIGEKMTGRITKFRYTSHEEGYKDDILVIVKNEEKGVCVEIPLSQVVGKASNNCELSQQRCAVYNNRGDIILTICKPLDFIIEKADRKTMNVVGRTNKELVNAAEARYHRPNYYRYHYRRESENKNNNSNDESLDN